MVDLKVVDLEVLEAVDVGEVVADVVVSVVVDNVDLSAGDMNDILDL